MLPNSMTGVMDTGAYGGLHSSYAQQNVPPPQPTSLYHPYQQQAQAPQRLAQNRSDVLQAMRCVNGFIMAQLVAKSPSAVLGMHAERSLGNIDPWTAHSSCKNSTRWEPPQLLLPILR